MSSFGPPWLLLLLLSWLWLPSHRRAGAKVVWLVRVLEPGARHSAPCYDIWLLCVWSRAKQSSVSKREYGFFFLQMTLNPSKDHGELTDRFQLLLILKFLLCQIWNLEIILFTFSLLLLYFFPVNRRGKKDKREAHGGVYNAIPYPAMKTKVAFHKNVRHFWINDTPPKRALPVFVFVFNYPFSPFSFHSHWRFLYWINSWLQVAKFANVAANLKSLAVLQLEGILSILAL